MEQNLYYKEGIGKMDNEKIETWIEILRDNNALQTKQILNLQKDVCEIKRELEKFQEFHRAILKLLDKYL